MARLYTTLFFVLLVLMVPVESAATGELAKLMEVKILVGNLSKESMEEGLNEEDIKNHVFIFLRSKLPRLKVSEINGPYVGIIVHLDHTETGGKKDGYFGLVEVEVGRSVLIIENKNITLTSVWSRSAILSGPLGNASTDVMKWLDRLLTSFAAAWYVDNP
ncbi:MAG: hypothetical protein V3T23_02920 [Nitrososphaerales archaeon]